MRKATKYTITTKIIKTKTADVYEVVDVVRFDSGNETTIKRFKGTKEACQKYEEKLGKYWKKTLSVKVVSL